MQLEVQTLPCWQLLTASFPGGALYLSLLGTQVATPQARFCPHASPGSQLRPSSATLWQTHSDAPRPHPTSVALPLPADGTPRLGPLFHPPGCPSRPGDAEVLCQVAPGLQQQQPKVGSSPACPSAALYARGWLPGTLQYLLNIQSNNTGNY